MYKRQGQAVDELVRGPDSQSLSSQGSLSAANVKVEGPSSLVMNPAQSQRSVSPPKQPVTDKSQSPAYRREPCRPVCHSAPPFVSHVDSDLPAHRRAEFPATDGAAYFPPVVTSTCGLPLDNGRRGQRDVVSPFVNAESQLPAAPAATVLHLSD